MAWKGACLQVSSSCNTTSFLFESAFLPPSHLGFKCRSFHSIKLPSRVQGKCLFILPLGVPTSCLGGKYYLEFTAQGLQLLYRNKNCLFSRTAKEIVHPCSLFILPSYICRCIFQNEYLAGRKCTVNTHLKRWWSYFSITYQSSQSFSFSVSSR